MMKITKKLLFVLLAAPVLMGSRCSMISGLLSDIENSSLNGKDLTILVFPPNEGTSDFKQSYEGSQLQHLFHKGINESNEIYKYQIEGTKITDVEPISLFYRDLSSTREKERREYMGELIEGSKFNQILFGLYKRSDASGEMSLRVYLFDIEEMTLAKEPYDGYKKISWKEKDKVQTAEDVTKLVRDLIARHFGA